MNGNRVKRARQYGFTLIELMVCLAIISTLAALAVPNFITFRERAIITKVITDIGVIEKAVITFEMDHYRMPATLAEIGMGGWLDPWGNPYQYLPVEGTPPGRLRKDRFLVPVNSDFDLYSMGKDGASQPPFTARASRDDIVRANNGSFIGPVSRF